MSERLTKMDHLGYILYINRAVFSSYLQARGQVIGEDGVRVHSMVLPGLPSSTQVYFSSPGDVIINTAIYFKIKLNIGFSISKFRLHSS